MLFLTGLVGSALAQVDDFSCPDEFEGFYPHLYRSVSPSLSLSLSHQGVTRVTQLKDREAGVVWCDVVSCFLYLKLNISIISLSYLREFYIGMR